MTGNDPERAALLNIMANWPKDSEAVIRKSSLDNLTWFIDRINEEIRKTEHLMEGPRPREPDGTVKRYPTPETHRQTISWLEEVRGIAREALHDKEVAARKRTGPRNLRKDIGLIIFGAVITLVLGALWKYFSETPTPE